MNITLLSIFLSTFTLIDADIDVTRRGAAIGKQEANPIAAYFTTANKWTELQMTAYLGNATGFILVGQLGSLMTNRFHELYPNLPQDIIPTALQYVYLFLVINIELYALMLWQNNGLPVHVKITPFIVLF